MPLSKEFYLDEIRSKYPNSYNESLKDLPIKDLEDMLDFLESALEKADGGSIGIEVLFGPKRDEFSIGGNVQRATTPQPYDPRASVADFARAIDKVGGGTDLQKAMDIQRYGENVRRQNIMDKFVNQPSFLGPATQQAAKNLNQGVLASQSALDMLNKTMTPFEPTLDSDRILEIVEQQRAAGVPETGLITNFKPNMADVAGPSTAATNTTGITRQDPFKLNQLQVSGAVTLDEVLDYAKRRGDPQSYLDFITREYNTIQQTPIDYLVREEKYKDASKSNITDELTRIYNQTLPQYRSADTLDKFISDYYKTNPYYADGGRVGLFMGGPPLEGTALSIYNSMSAYGFSDQEIADALQEQGLYTPGATTEETGIIASAPNIINQQTGGGGDGPPPGPTFNRNDLLGTSDYQGTGPGIVDSLKNTATGLFDLYQKFSPFGIISNFMKQRAEKQQEIQNNAIEKARKEREMQEAIAEAERKEKERAAQYGATNYGKGADGQQSYSGDAIGASGLGFGVGATTGGPVSNRTGRGRQDYSKGGLATMFKDKR